LCKQQEALFNQQSKRGKRCANNRVREESVVQTTESVIQTTESVVQTTENVVQPTE
jgi:hypothetical protein